MSQEYEFIPTRSILVEEDDLYMEFSVLEYPEEEKRFRMPSVKVFFKQKSDRIALITKEDSEEMALVKPTEKWDENEEYWDNDRFMFGYVRGEEWALKLLESDKYQRARPMFKAIVNEAIRMGYLIEEKDGEKEV